VSVGAADLKSRIEAANAEAVGRMTASDPVLIDVVPAREIARDLGERMILHAGPPISWERMAGAMRGSVIGLVLFEGWADTPAHAERMLAAGEVQLEPNHEHGGVGPMAGTTSPSLPVFVVEDRASGTRAFCRPVEGRQQFGDFSDEALGHLRQWRSVWAPSIQAAVRHLGGVPLRQIIAKALQMGDELHNRPNAASSLFANTMAAPLVEANVPRAELVGTLRYLAGNEFLFLALSMASGKVAADAAAGVEGSTVVTAMSRNGTEFGIRLSGLGDTWFTAPAPRVEGLFLPGYSAADAGLDMGDSAITETVGWGGFTLGGAPGILALTGGTPEQALAYTREMRKITVTTHPVYRLPVLSFEGTSVGIDARLVVSTGIAPVIDTAIAHREPGHPKIGGGLVRAPMACFEAAIVAFSERYASNGQ
jgi:hypothetical protein